MNSQLFRLFSINPNIIFVAIVVLIGYKFRLPFLFFLFGLLLMFAFSFQTFWVSEYVFLIFISIIFLYIRRFMTGNILGDVALFCFFGTGLIGGLRMLWSGVDLSLISILIEAMYNALFGLVLAFFAKPFMKKSGLTRL